MPFAALLLFLVVIGVPVGWVFAVFHPKRAVRFALGLLTILCGLGVAVMFSYTLNELNYNAWYGSATKDLIDTTVRQIEDGKLDRVMIVLRSLNSQFRPTYENRANYQELVEGATARMRGDVAIAQGSKWDAAPFDQSTWLGHWEEDTGFWIVIDTGLPLDIVRSGYPGVEMEAVALSDDFRVVTFNEGAQWRHTLKLLNKYEADHTWFDLEKQSVWRTDHLYKLVRPTPDQKRMTQQDEPTENKAAK